MAVTFKDRVDAGIQLAQALSRYKGEEVVVYALPRGGAVVGAEVAKYLDAPLALLFPRKIGHPASPEYAIGAVTETGKPIWNKVERYSASDAWIDQQIEEARNEARRRRIRYEGDQPPVNTEGKTAIVIDDGIATGLTMRAAIEELRQQNPKQVIAAVPVAAPGSLHAIRDQADEVLCLHTPDGFMAIGGYYQYFDQVEDEEVRQLVGAYRKAPVEEPLDLAALNAVVSTVKRYPVTSEEITAQAKRLNAPKNVVAFFETIPDGVAFKNKSDIMTRSEEAEILMEEASWQPEERLRSYD